MDKKDRLRESVALLQDRAEVEVEAAIGRTDGPWVSLEVEGDWIAPHAQEVANAFERRGYCVDQVRMWEGRFVVLARKREHGGEYVDDRMMAHIANHDREYIVRILDAVQEHPDHFGASAGESKLAVAADIIENLSRKAKANVEG